MEKVEIEQFGIIFTEPVTFVTNLLIALCCRYFYVRYKNLPDFSEFNLYWRRFFMYLGISFFISGFGHLFNHYEVTFIHLTAWSFTGISTYSLQMSAASFVRSPKLKKTFSIVAIAQIPIFLAFLYITKSFTTVLVHQTISVILFFLSVHFYRGMKFKNVSFKWMMFGLVLMVVSAMLFNPKYAISPWFTQADTAHMVMIVSLYVFYVAGVKEIDNPNKRELFK